MRLDAAALPTDRKLGADLLWSVSDLVQPALDLARTPGSHSALDLATAIFNGGGGRLAAVQDAITAVEALHPGYAFHATAARANLDAWFAALPFADPTPLPAPAAWAYRQVNTELGRVVRLASLAMPVVE